MEVIFEKDYLREIYKTGKTIQKNYRFQPDIIRKYIRIVDLMIEQPDITSLAKFNSLRYERLKGRKLGISSVRINDQYRIEFEERTVENHTITTICNIIELSNHYK